MYKLNFRSTFPTDCLVLYVKAVLYLLFHYQEIHGNVCKTCLALTMFNIKDVNSKSVSGDINDAKTSSVFMNHEHLISMIMAYD